VLQVLFDVAAMKPHFACDRRDRSRLMREQIDELPSSCHLVLADALSMILVGIAELVEEFRARADLSEVHRRSYVPT